MNDKILRKQPADNLRPRVRFPWAFVLRWLVLVYAAVSFISFSWFSIFITETVPVSNRVFIVLLQLLFLAGALVLVKVPKLAWYAAGFFSAHLIVSFIYTLRGAPHLIFEVGYLAKWAVSVVAIALSAHVAVSSSQSRSAEARQGAHRRK